MTELESIYNSVISEIGLSTSSVCRLSVSFVSRYLANAALSYIEDKEQDLALSMKYDEWVNISKREVEEIADRMIDYVEVLIKSCKALEPSKFGSRVLDFTSRTRLKQKILEEKVVQKTLCYLYNRGIYDDNLSIYIVIKDVKPDRCEEILNSIESFKVRSRFIELAKYLYNLKQRFPDRTIYESAPLVDRVFAYAEPRLLPIGTIDPLNAYEKELSSYIERLYTIYNQNILNRTPERNEVLLVHEVLRGFFKYLRDKAGMAFYKYQVDGIRAILESTLRSLSGSEMELKIIEAPTGAGKTEIFVITILIAALIRKVSHFFCKQQQKCILYDVKEPTPPIAMIVYPRLALASNQVERIIKYLHELNKLLKNKLSNIPPITLSMNYTDVRFKSEYAEKAKNAINEMRETDKHKVEVRLPYGVKAYVTPLGDGRRYLLTLTHFKCHNGEYPSLIYDSREVLTSELICGDERVDYIRATKDDVKENPGDIHITLFETLRNNLLSKTWRWIFGNKLERPLFIVLDEVHTYVGIQGARYAYVLRRLIARAKLSCKRELGFVVIGVSATIPNPEEFVRDLFFYKGDLKQVFIRPREEELVPMGSEYFFIIIPTNKYPVNLLNVTIQSVMALHFNTPGFVNTPLSSGENDRSGAVARTHVKKTLVFIDNLDVVSRALRDLRDAVNRYKTRGLKECDEPYGLQDLRNPANRSCFEITTRDYADNVQSNVGDILHRLDDFKSWRDGEVWWPYALEYEFVYKHRDILAKIDEYTSRLRGRVEELDIVVATSALEVGIDYRDVVVIYQHGAPINISSLVQRAGRAGRRIYQNPLTRTVVSIQLSPDNPIHTPYFEIFTRVRSLREALKYDKLYVPTENKLVVEQTLIEALLDYLVATGKIKTVFSSNKDVRDLECEVLPDFIVRALREHEVLYYLSIVFPSKTPDEISKIVESLRKTIVSACRTGGPHAT